MTIEELIDQVLQSIARDFYGDERVREYMRDRNALIKAIARYGYKCDERGWYFQVSDILGDLMKLLISMRDKTADIKYLPKYLEGAIDRHIGQRAEELSAAAKGIRARATVHKVVEGLQKVELAREKSPTEILADVYRALRSSRAGTSKTKPKPAQKDLL